MNAQIEQIKALEAYEARNKEDTFLLTWFDIKDRFGVMIHDTCNHPNCSCAVKLKVGDKEFQAGTTEEYETWIRPFAQLFLIPSIERELPNKLLTPGVSWELKSKSPTVPYNWRFTVVKKNVKKRMISLVLQSTFNPSYVPKHREPVAAPEHDPC